MLDLIAARRQISIWTQVNAARVRSFTGVIGFFVARDQRPFPSCTVLIALTHTDNAENVQLPSISNQ